MTDHTPAPTHSWGRAEIYATPGAFVGGAGAGSNLSASSSAASPLPVGQGPFMPRPHASYTPSRMSESVARPAVSAPGAAAAASGADPYAAPVSLFSSAPPRGEPIKLFNDKRDEERNGDKYEDMSAVFSVITATERLENIWARWGAISQEDYECQCDLLIQQYRVLRDSTAEFIPKIDKFINEYDIKASKARPRLAAGYPVTVKGPTKPRDQHKYVFRCTSLFHQLGNCIDMNQLQVGVLLPDLISLMKTLKSISALPQDFEFNKRIVYWVEKLNAMPAAVEMTHDDASQLKLDLDNGYVELETAISD